MENQNIKPEPTQEKPDSDGIDKWNDRLDRNLESEKEGNETADENARDYSNEHGSGDQSDEEED